MKFDKKALFHSDLSKGSNREGRTYIAQAVGIVRVFLNSEKN